jgi:hypothetical protein
MILQKLSSELSIVQCLQGLLVLFLLKNIFFFGIFLRIFLLIKKKKSLSGKQFLKEKNGNLVCEECNAKTAPKCTQCKQTFAPGESYKKITDSLFYHNHCFVCCGPCHKPIGAEFYDMENDKYLCIECYDKYGSDYDQAGSNDQPKYTKDLASDLNSKLNLNRNNPDVEVLPAKQREQNSFPNVKPAQPTAPAAPSLNKSDENVCFKCHKELVGTYTVYSDR